MARLGPARTERGVIEAFGSIANFVPLYLRMFAAYRLLTVIASKLVVPGSSGR